MLSQDIVNSGCLSSSFAVGRSSPLHSRHRSMTSRIAGHTLSGIGGGFVVEAICQRESKLSFHTGQSVYSQTILYIITTSFSHVDLDVIYCMVFVLNTLFCCLWDE